MKWLLTFNIFAAGVGLFAAEPMPMAGVLPHPVPLSTSPTVPQPTLSGSSWNTYEYSQPAMASFDRSCNTPCCGTAKGGSAFERLCEWISFRPCPPVHKACVAQPYRAPLRAYFSNSDCGVGCANASDCRAGCGKARSYGGTSESVTIPLPQRGCASSRCGGSPMSGSHCGGGTMNRMLGFFGLTSGSCGSKSCGSCGGLGGCSSCQYTKTPMSDIGQYHNFSTTQSVGRTNGLSNVGAAPAGSHFANPYRASGAGQQYSQPAAILAPAKTMTPPQAMSQGTSPFPGPNGTLPFSTPYSNR